MLTTDGLAKITDESVMPIGLGRKIHDIATFQNLLRHGSVNVLRPSLGLNSLTKIKRMAALAETHYVAIAPYHDGGPIGTMAGIHLAAALPNSFVQQNAGARVGPRRGHARRDHLGQQRSRRTRVSPPCMNRPGLGFEVNERALDTYSEERI